jgi:hypothetical protein
VTVRSRAAAAAVQTAEFVIGTSALALEILEHDVAPDVRLNCTGWPVSVAVVYDEESDASWHWSPGAARDVPAVAPVVTSATPTST